MATADRTGPAYALARSDVDSAAGEARQTQLEWANDLAAAGRVDAALALLDSLDSTDAGVRRTRAQVALRAADAAAAAGRPEEALRLLDALVAGSPPADLAAAANARRPELDVEAAAPLVAQGRGVEAVAALDAAVAAGGAPAEAARRSLPGTLLAAGRQRADVGDADTARSLLQRLTDTFPSSLPARDARALLAAPQSVTGTLLAGDGSAAAGVAVRLAGGYRRAAAGGFTLGGPYYTARTDAIGGFRVDQVPVGVMLVLQYLDAGGWELIVDDSRNPAYSVTVQPLAPLDLAYVRQPSA